MDDLGRMVQGSVKARKRRRVGLVVALLALGLTFGAAPVIGDGLNRQATPNETVVVDSVPASEAQVGATTLNGAATSAGKRVRRRIGKKKVFIESRITDSKLPIVTEEGRGTFVGIKCPGGSVAVSGGVLTSYINLLISSSAPNNPLTGKYTPRIWWLTVTNANVDGRGGSLSWRGLVNCVSPVKIKR